MMDDLWRNAENIEDTHDREADPEQAEDRMTKRTECYQQGYTDVCVKLGDRTPPQMLIDDDKYVDEDSDEFDQVAYLNGQMAALLDHVKREDAGNYHAANVASCLANGIIPD